MRYELNNIYNEDCLQAMKQFPDKYFELAIVDPPYGIGESGGAVSRHHSQKKYTKKDWDNCPPDQEYFDQLFRVSKNQIIWGANHFISRIPKDSPCWIFWDKDRFGDFADGELAWTSFKTAVRYFKFTWDGFRKQIKEDRFHPTQKPTSLYRWILQNYANPGDKILDTHGGSFSSVIACLEMGFEYIGFEIDKEYYQNGLKRIQTYLKQPKLFKPEQLQPEQTKLF